jgi:hypothetical protein
VFFYINIDVFTFLVSKIFYSIFQISGITNFTEGKSTVVPYYTTDLCNLFTKTDSEKSLTECLAILFLLSCCLSTCVMPLDPMSHPPTSTEVGWWSQYAVMHHYIFIDFYGKVKDKQCYLGHWQLYWLNLEVQMWIVA